MIEDPVYRVFISSTYEDLKNERECARRIVTDVGFLSLGMESFLSSDRHKCDIIKEEIDKCDYFILILGKKYGSYVKDDIISYTEMEYNYALKQNKPILAFIIDSKIESDDEKEDYQRFRKRLTYDNDCMVSYWKDEHSLEHSISKSLYNTKLRNLEQENKRIKKEKKELEFRFTGMELKDIDHIIVELSLAKDELVLKRKNEADSIKIKSLEKDISELEFGIRDYKRYSEELKKKTGLF